MALTNVRDTKFRTVELKDAALVTNVTAYKGALIVLDTADGFAKPATTAQGLVALGIAAMSEPSVSTTGIASGVKKIPVKTGIALLANSADGDAIANAQRGAPCYIVDDQTVAKTDGDGTRSVAGTVEEVVSAGVWVRIGSLDGTALAGEIAAREALATDLASATGTTLAGLVRGTQVATVANANVIGGIEVAHRITVADAATGDVDVVLTHKTMVTEVEVIKTGGAGGADDTITVKNGATAITDAIDINVEDKVVKYAGTIDDAQQTIAAGGTLKITRTKASANNTACIVIVRGLRVS